MKKNVKIAIEAVLLIACIGLVFAIYKSIMQPVEFNRQKEYRESVAIQRLKDIRTLQVAFKSVYGRFSPTADSLVNFYNNGKMEIQMQVGSKDDSLAWANTEKLRKQGLKDADLLQRYLAGEKNLVFAIKQPIAVKDTLFRSRTDFCIDSLRYIPFSKPTCLTTSFSRASTSSSSSTSGLRGKTRTSTTDSRSVPSTRRTTTPATGNSFFTVV